MKPEYIGHYANQSKDINAAWIENTSFWAHMIGWVAILAKEEKMKGEAEVVFVLVKTTWDGMLPLISTLSIDGSPCGGREGERECGWMGGWTNEGRKGGRKGWKEFKINIC
jgi:hypothetical protein